MEEAKTDNSLYTKISGTKFHNINSTEKFIFKVTAIKVNDKGIKPVSKQRTLKFYEKFFLTMKVCQKCKFRMKT